MKGRYIRICPVCQHTIARSYAPKKSHAVMRAQETQQKPSRSLVGNRINREIVVAPPECYEQCQHTTGMSVRLGWKRVHHRDPLVTPENRARGVARNDQLDLRIRETGLKLQNQGG